MIEIGFTGTQGQPTSEQAQLLTGLLRMYRQQYAICLLRHGDCVGADAYAHRLARSLNFEEIIIHPSFIRTKRAFCRGDKILPLAEPLKRNHSIVQACVELVALPGQQQEILRSGTWATIRQARRKNKKVTIIYPNGRVDIESILPQGPAIPVRVTATIEYELAVFQYGL